MTATPWRLSEIEGFDHLFRELICGPQVSELQKDSRFLCNSRTIVPPEGDRVVGGIVGATGDYTESGIEHANATHKDVMTARALAFWHRHAKGRPTVAYAVSKRHARNLAAVFEEADTPSAVLLGDTPAEERKKAITGFKRGTITALVNVAVATEGFDLPDASCVLIARPTMSLALYLQMVGRGLRSKTKSNHNDCIVLDLAANSLEHGLPEECRQWSLVPRGRKRLSRGNPPVVLCPHCETASPASAQECSTCGHPFGKVCDRCGKWRSWRRWEHEDLCGDAHDRVCDLCHADAHLDKSLPLPPELGLADDNTWGEDMDLDNIAMNEDLAHELARALNRVLKDELALALSTDIALVADLRERIAVASSVLTDDDRLARSYEDHLATLPEHERPQNRVQDSRLLAEYENSLRSKLAKWKRDLNTAETRPIDDRSILDRAQTKVLHMFRREALALDFDVYGTSDTSALPSNVNTVNDEWSPLASLHEMPSRPRAIRFPDGVESQVSSGQDMYRNVVEWLIKAGHLSEGSVDRELRRWLRHDAKSSKKLSNGMWLYTNLKRDKMLENCRLFVVSCGEDASRFHVSFS